jgi:hypothetical protein
MPEYTFSFLNAVATDDLDDLLGALAADDITPIRFDGSGVTDKDSFLARADIDLPRPEDLHPHNWDALADTLWNGLAATEGAMLAIVWTDADRMAHGDLQDFLVAVDLLVTAARSASVPVLLFLVGSGAGFRRLVPIDD